MYHLEQCNECSYYGKDKASKTGSIINVTRRNKRTLEIPGQRATEIVSVQRIKQMVSFCLSLEGRRRWAKKKNRKTRRRDRCVRGRKRRSGRTVE
jgi:hypothetical protein